MYSLEREEKILRTNRINLSELHKKKHLIERMEFYGSRAKKKEKRLATRNSILVAAYIVNKKKIK